MAQFPCDHCGLRYRGPQNTAYPSLMRGSRSFRQKARLCQDCLHSLEVFLQDHESADVIGPLPRSCSTCGVDNSHFVFFVTLYRAGEDRDDFSGTACEECALRRVVPTFWGLSDELLALDALGLGPTQAPPWDGAEGAS